MRLWNAIMGYFPSVYFEEPSIIDQLIFIFFSLAKSLLYDCDLKTAWEMQINSSLCRRKLHSVRGIIRKMADFSKRHPECNGLLNMNEWVIFFYDQYLVIDRLHIYL